MAHNSDEPASNCYSHFVSGHHAQVHELEKQVKAVEQFNQSTDALQNDCENKGRGKTPTRSKKPLSALEEMQKEVRRHFNQILTEITQLKCAWMFMAPVDVKGLKLYNYYEIIEKPMDLGTVKKKMMAKDKSGYKNAREMYEDVKLTFKNAITYNKKGTGVRVAAKTLLNKFEKKWQDLLPKVEKAESLLLMEESHKRLYKMLVPEATYANMARGLSTEIGNSDAKNSVVSNDVPATSSKPATSKVKEVKSRKRGSRSTSGTVPKKTKQSTILSSDDEMEDIGIAKKTSTSMGTSETNATSHVAPKVNGSHVEKEAEKKRKKKEALSTEPSGVRVAKKKEIKKKKSESPSKTIPEASVQDERTEQPQDPKIAAEFDTVNKTQENTFGSKGNENKPQENLSPSKVVDSPPTAIPEEIIDNSSQQQQPKPTEQQNNPVVETRVPPNKEMVIETEENRNQHVENLQETLKESEIPNPEHQAPPHVEKKQETDSTEQIDIEEFFDPDTDLSARTGGSSLTPESPTSKISAAAGIPAHLLKGLNATSPEDALEKLIASRSSNSNTQGQSTLFDQEVRSKVGQDAMKQRFKQDFIRDNIFEVVEKDPNSVFALKAFLGRLQNPRTHEGLLFLVTQAESHLEQFAKDFQKRANNQQMLDAQIQAHSFLWLQANNCHKNVEEMKRQSKDALEVASCDANIAKWEAEMQELETKIADEKIRKEKFAKTATKVPKDEIKATAAEGLKCFNRARIIDDEIKRLTEENEVLDKKLAQKKELYYNFRQAAANNI